MVLTSAPKPATTICTNVNGNLGFGQIDNFQHILDTKNYTLEN